MIMFIAIVLAVVHFVPWLILVLERDNDIDLSITMVMAGVILSLFVYYTIMMYPPVIVIYLFTASYSWYNLILYKDS